MDAAFVHRGGGAGKRAARRAFWPWREALEGCGVDVSRCGDDGGRGSDGGPIRAVPGGCGRARARGGTPAAADRARGLHAADRSTLLLLEFVAEPAPRTSRSSSWATYRDLEARLRPDAADVLGAARHGRARCCSSRALPEADVAALVRDAIEDADERLAATVYETTHGNPLFVDEMVRDVRARGVERGVPIPLGVREIIRQRLGLVSRDGAARARGRRPCSASRSRRRPTRRMVRERRRGAGRRRA